MTEARLMAAALADAMLSGPADPHAAKVRCARTAGRRHRWLDTLVQAMLARFGDDWSPGRRDELARAIGAHPAFREARRDGRAATVRHVHLLPAAMGPVPVSLAACARPDLPTAADLAVWLGLDAGELDWLAQPSLRRRADHYVYRWLPKRSGGWRLVESPKARLRGVQHRILHGLLDYVPPHEAAHGFRERHSILTNALAHLGQRVVLRMDLEDFFLSVRRPRVEALMRTLGYPAHVARLLAALCTNSVPDGALPGHGIDGFGEPRPQDRWQTRHRYREWHLPQGAPSSPALANLCAYRLDARLQGLATHFGARYTRYADDLTFSGDSEFLRAVDEFVPRAGAIVLDEGLRPNFRKTRVATNAGRQVVTGVVVNRHPNVRRDEFDRLKATLHNCLRRGAVAENRESHPDFRAHLAGRVAHVAMLNPARGARLRELFEGIDWQT